MGSIVLANRETVIERVAKGDRLIDIAHDLGLKSAGAICNALGNNPEFIQARMNAIETRIETREKELEASGDSVSVNRAKELLSHARWRAERENPSRWGQTNKLQVEHIGDLGARLRRARERVIDGEITKPERALGLAEVGTNWPTTGLAEEAPPQPDMNLAREGSEESSASPRLEAILASDHG